MIIERLPANTKQRCEWGIKCRNKATVMVPDDCYATPSCEACYRKHELEQVEQFRFDYSQLRENRQ
jgi:hypothetical protein